PPTSQTGERLRERERERFGNRVARHRPLLTPASPSPRSPMKRILFACGVLLVFAAPGRAQAPAKAALPAPDADDGGITLPPGFRALIYADDLVVNKRVGNSREALRGLAVAPNGDLFAKGKFGKIWALRDTNGDGRVDKI